MYKTFDIQVIGIIEGEEGRGRVYWSGQARTTLIM